MRGSTRGQEAEPPCPKSHTLSLGEQWVESAAAPQGKEDLGMGSDTPVTGGSFLGLAGILLCPRAVTSQVHAPFP